MTQTAKDPLHPSVFLFLKIPTVISINQNEGGQ